MLTERKSMRPEKTLRPLYGIQLKPSEYKWIQQRLNNLLEKCPYDCSYDLNFEMRKSSFISSLSINSLNKVFASRKVAPNLFQSFILIEEDIEQQLLDWKRKRFSRNLSKNLQEIGIKTA